MPTPKKKTKTIPTADEIFGDESTDITAGAARDFKKVSDDSYRLTIDSAGIDFHVNRLRYKHDELIGELVVYCDIAGSQTYNGILSAANWNLNSTRAISERARLLERQARAKDINWHRLLTELGIRIAGSMRTDDTSVLLNELPEPTRDLEFQSMGLTMPKTDMTIIFGDGGTFKSYLALSIIGDLAQRGVAVGYFDWESSKSIHRMRLGQLFRGRPLPTVRYDRSRRALVQDLERLQRIVQTHQLKYLVIDSIGYAILGAPEAAEAALDFCRAVGQLDIGTCVLAHVPKLRNGAVMDRPYGSTFFHNSARSTYAVKLASPELGQSDRVKQIAILHMKNNNGPLQKPVGYEITTSEDKTEVTFEQIAVANNASLAQHLPLHQRIRHAVRSTPKTIATLADELGHGNVKSLERIVRRHNNIFTQVTDNSGVIRVGLVEGRLTQIDD